MIGKCVIVQRNEKCPWAVANLITKHNYYDKPTVTLYEEKSRYGYYDIINNNIPCIVTFIAAPKGSSLLTDNKVSNFLKRYNIDNIKFQILSRFNGEEIMFVIPIELEDD